MCFNRCSVKLQSILFLVKNQVILSITAVPKDQNGCEQASHSLLLSHRASASSASEFSLISVTDGVHA